VASFLDKIARLEMSDTKLTKGAKGNQKKKPLIMFSKDLTCVSLGLIFDLISFFGSS